MCFKGGRGRKCFKVVSLNDWAGASIHLRQVVDLVGDRVDGRSCDLVAHADQMEVHVGEGRGAVVSLAGSVGSFGLTGDLGHSTYNLQCLVLICNCVRFILCTHFSCVHK